MNRQAIKIKHEDYIINKFVEYLFITTGLKYEITNRPEPPDAIIKCNSHITWIEICDIYRSKEEAHEEYSFANPNELKYNRINNPIYEPDKSTAQKAFEIFSKKISKPSYSEATRLYGKGMLILNERDNLFSETTLDEIVNLFNDPNKDLNIHSDYFHKAYLSYREGNGLQFKQLIVF